MSPSTLLIQDKTDGTINNLRNTLHGLKRFLGDWRTTTQVVVLVAATVAASILLLTVLFVRSLTETAYENRRELTASRAQAIERLLFAADGNLLASRFINRAQFLAEDAEGTNGVTAFFVVDRSGLILVHSDPGATGGRYGNPDMVKALELDRTVTSKEEEDGILRLDVVVPLHYEGAVVGAIETKYSLEFLDREIEQTQRDALLSALVVFLILIPLAATVIAHFQRALEHMAVSDGLSDLYDHRYFQERLSEEVKRSHRYGREISLIMFDVDGFKDYNDTYGHLVGDEAIKAIAQVLKDGVREVDVAARYGGEEFAVILPETGVEAAYLVAERIRKMISDKFTVGGKPGPLTASFGIASCPNDSAAYDDLIRCADLALYQAKLAGKNRVCIYSAVPKQVPFTPTLDVS